MTYTKICTFSKKIYPDFLSKHVFTEIFQFGIILDHIIIYFYKILKFFFKHIHPHAKTLLIFYPRTWNSITGIVILHRQRGKIRTSAQIPIILFTIYNLLWRLSRWYIMHVIWCTLEFYKFVVHLSFISLLYTWVLCKTGR